MILPKNIILILLYFFSCNSIFTQTDKVTLQSIWNNNKNDPIKRIDARNKLIIEHYLYSKPDSAYIMCKNLYEFVTLNKIDSRKGQVLLTFGNIENTLGNIQNATSNYVEALKIFKETKYNKGIASAYNNLGKTYKTSWDFDKALKYYNESLKINEQLNDSNQIGGNLTNIANIYSNRYKLDTAKIYYEKSIAILEKTGDLRSEILAKLNLGNNLLNMKQTNNGLNLINEVLQKSKTLNDKYIETGAYHILMSYYYHKNLDNKALYYAKLCLPIAEETNNKQMKDNCYSIFYDIYKNNGNFKLANNYLEKRLNLNFEFEKLKSTQQLQKLEIERYRIKDSMQKVEETLKLELEHQNQIQQKNKEKSNLTLAWGGSISALSILAFIVYRKTKRKQLFAEKEKQLEIEKKERILKDLELNTINAMIEGQEKERERLALDLHDSVGATLSAAKMQFQYLAQNNNITKSQDFITKISTLLEDAYVQVRSMAHLKNSGVMAKNGLLPAIENLSHNASGTNGLNINVRSHGLESRLENSIELTIFRIVQELITNIIKHAEATSATIYLTNYKNTINIMIEDNGKGFQPNVVATKNKGMGISSIDKRVANLNGTMTIESEPNKGTSIIIDIPI